MLYKYSGKFSFSTFPILILFAILIWFFAAPIYGDITAFNPIIYFNIILFFIASIGFICILRSIIFIGKIRNKKIWLFICLIFGTAAWYKQIVVWTDNKYENYESLNRKNLDTDTLLLNPKLIFKIWNKINISVSGSVRRRSFEGSLSGIEIYFICFLEAILFLLFCLVTIRTIDKPFSEQTKEWIEPTVFLISNTSVKDKDIFLFNLKKNNYSILRDVIRSYHEKKALEIRIYDCDDKTYFSFFEIIPGIRRFYGITLTPTPNKIVDKIMIPNDVAEKFIFALKKMI